MMFTSNPVLGTTSNVHSNHNDPLNSADAAQDLVFTEEDDDWIAVKKQRVEDWIPPLPSTENSNFHNSLPGHYLHDIPCGGVDGNTCSHLTKNTSTSKKRSSATGVKSRSSLSATKKVPLTRNDSSMAKLSEKLLFGESSSRDHQIVATKAAATYRLNVLCKTSTARYGLRSIKPPRMIPGLTYSSNGSSRLSETIRASNLDRKLRRAGGLSRWLISIGLKRFVRIFQSRNIGKFQLVHMSMDKLKDMGADAVGPRRKLMHAIDCLCQPPCFQALGE